MYAPFPPPFTPIRGCSASPELVGEKLLCEVARWAIHRELVRGDREPQPWDWPFIPMSPRIGDSTDVIPRHRSSSPSYRWSTYAIDVAMGRLCTLAAGRPFARNSGVIWVWYELQDPIGALSSVGPCSSNVQLYCSSSISPQCRSSLHRWPVAQCIVGQPTVSS